MTVEFVLDMTWVFFKLGQRTNAHSLNTTVIYFLKEIQHVGTCTGFLL